MENKKNIFFDGKLLNHIKDLKINDSIKEGSEIKKNPKIKMAVIGAGPIIGERVCFEPIEDRFGNVSLIHAGDRIIKKIR